MDATQHDRNTDALTRRRHLLVRSFVLRGSLLRQNALQQLFRRGDVILLLLLHLIMDWICRLSADAWRAGWLHILRGPTPVAFLVTLALFSPLVFPAPSLFAGMARHPCRRITARSPRACRFDSACAHAALAGHQILFETRRSGQAIGRRLRGKIAAARVALAPGRRH